MDRVKTWLITAVLCSLFLAVGSDPSSAQIGRVGVRPGDQVVIEFYTAAGKQLPEVAGERIVDQSGEVFLPYVGPVSVEGMTAGEIRNTLLTRFGNYYEAPVIDVQVRFRVNVTGAVRTPGNYLVDPTTTIVDVVSKAGGLGTSVSSGIAGGAPDAERVHLFRNGRTSILDLRAEEANPELLGMHVSSGDWIWVPAKSISVWRENLSLIGGVLSIAASVVWIANVVN